MKLLKLLFTLPVNIFQKLNCLSCFIFSYFYFLSIKRPYLKKLLACFIMTFVTLSFSYYLSKVQSGVIAQESLPDCASLPSDQEPLIGQNCLYFGLEQCKNLSPSQRKPRQNCADLIDLPLCSQIVTNQQEGIVAMPGKNCVNLCSGNAYNDPNPNSSTPLQRSIDYAVHNVDCLRFCDDPEGGVSIISEGDNANCVQRKCHQMPTSVDPDPKNENCDLLKCNMLTPDELNKPKFDDSSKKYCDGEIKCYEFVHSQLPYLRVRSDNTMCQIHNCKPEIDSCGVDETQFIRSKGESYVEQYRKFINANQAIESTIICNPVYCEPVVKSQYRCVNDAGDITGNNDYDIFTNPKCDQQGEGSSCLSNYCYKTIDCNLKENKSSSECRVNTNNPDPNADFDDPYQSWFYRPKPLNKALTGNAVLKNMEPARLCYRKSHMQSHGWGYELKVPLLLTTVNLGYFHSHIFDDSRSPGSCNAPRHGHRGQGYLYLCGTKGLLYNKPSENASYYSGYVRTNFYGNSAKHVIRICTRFKNTINLNACGRRECGIAYTYGALTGQQCGGDVCHDIEVDEADPLKCMMNRNMAKNSESGCSRITDKYIRTRAVQYGDRICAFMDSKGQLAYNKMFMNGSEQLSLQRNDGTESVFCVNDPNSSPAEGDGCSGYNSNEYEGLADKWRALFQVPYVQNNRPESDRARGYLDRDGRIYKEILCPKITLRIPPPIHYNLANIINSERLFVPPLYIKSAVKIRGGEDSISSGEGPYGKTDFHYPEIRVQYGPISTKMSLGLDEISGKDIDGSGINLLPESPAYQTLKLTLRGREYIAEMYVSKEFNETTHDPLFCLYRRIKNANGMYVEPYRIGCIEREIPDINNKLTMLRTASLSENAEDKKDNQPTTLPRITKTSIKPLSKYDDAEIEVRFLTDFGENQENDNCSIDDICSKKISIANDSFQQATCTKKSENYKLCAKKEECSQLYVECAKNEINYNNALNNSEPISEYESYRSFCNDSLISFCNKKRGIYDSNSANIYEMNPNDELPDEKIYGWFNELCIVSGFEEKLKNVFAYSPQENILGKCVIDALSPYLTDSDPNTNCDEGGFAPNCLCAEAAEGENSGSGLVIRKQTPREAGLCVDMKKPKLCPAIDYNVDQNIFDLSDPEYIYHSLGKVNYDNNNGVHMSHLYRSEGKEDPVEIPLAGHAEFSASFFGVEKVRGVCKGYWTYDKNSFGVTLYPKMNCLNDNEEAVWDIENLQNPCVRYSCPIVTTLGISEIGDYQNDYGALETGENKGLSNGFALWPRYQKNNDFLENVTASSCIAGFKPQGSEAIINNDKIIGYQNGNLPTRDCDQLGNWREPQSQCQRISCPAINPTIPQSANDYSAWQEWFEAGGAVYPEVNASRSKSRIQDGATSYGSCDNNLGFFQVPGGEAPSRECDYLGNWGPVINPCVSTCSEISDITEASNLNNGFARWSEAQIDLQTGQKEGEFLGCVPGYVQYPYPPTKSIDGEVLDDANDLSRPAENPQRLCRAGLTSLGIQVNVWSVTINSCINKCPGADYDSRIGVGKTKHETSDGEIIINWPSADFGTYQYVTNWSGNEEHLNASEFQKDRNNGKYLLKRYCNFDGSWSEPETMCSLNEGIISNAKYFESNKNPGFTNSLSVERNEEIQGSCIEGFWGHNNNTEPEPKRQCVFEEGNKNIDQVYLKLTDQSKECEEVTCPPLDIKAQKNSSNGRYDIVTSERKRIGTIVQGRCVNDSNRGIWTTLKGRLPSKICKNDGTWQDHERGSNNACKLGCDIYYRNSLSPHVRNRVLGQSVTCEINGSIADGQVVAATFAIQNGHSQRDCDSMFAMLRCDDGRVTSSSDAHYDGSGTLCEVRSYNPHSRQMGFPGFIVDKFHNSSGNWFYSGRNPGDVRAGIAFSAGPQVIDKYGNRTNIYYNCWGGYKPDHIININKTHHNF